MKNIRLVCVASILVLLARMWTTPMRAQGSLPPTYFNEFGAGGQSQLRVVEGSGQAHNVFTSNNDGIFVSVSPNGNRIAFIRPDGASPPNDNEMLWIGNIQTGQQSSIGSSGMKSVGGFWSPDSRYLLMYESVAVMPLWAGYNYGQLSIYDTTTSSKTALTGVQGLVIGWYSDSQSILLWNQTAAYFKYSLSSRSTQALEILDLRDRNHLYWSTLAPSAPLLAISFPFPAYQAVHVYDAQSGAFLKRISETALGGSNINTMHWSPQGTYLAITSTEGSVAIWNYVTDSLVAHITNPLGDRPFGIEWTADGQYLAFVFEGGYRTTVYYANAQTGQVSKVYETPVTLKLQYYPDPDEAGTIGDAIGPDFNIVNTGSSSVPLSELKIRYYFTREGTSPLRFRCWYTELPGGCASVTGQFVTLSTPVAGADTYVEIGFTGGALAANGQTGEIYINVTKQDWSDFNQGNGYSFRSSGEVFTDWNKITLYRNNDLNLMWGIVPN